MKSSLKMIRRKQAGITLVETAIALAIAAVVISAAFAGFQANARRSEVRDNSQLISEMVADTKQLFGPSNRYSSLDTGAAIAARIVPNNLIVSPTEARNSYGGLVAFAPAAAGSNDQAVMVFENVPTNQCADLALSVERPVVSMVIGPNNNGTAPAAPAAGDSLAGATSGLVKNGIATNAADRAVSISEVTAACTGSGREEHQIAVFFARN